jgi:hypothetical protein
MMRIWGWIAVCSLSMAAPGLAAGLQVVGLDPPRNRSAAVTTRVSVTFDRAVLQSSITPATFRVFGRRSGTASGTYLFLDGGKTVVFQPSHRFSAGEIVVVNLSHDITAVDMTKLRSAGYAYQFGTRTEPSLRVFREIDAMSNRTGGAQTRIYGALACDFNGDRFLDLGTVNEVSADVRVFLNRADGTGLFDDFLDPTPIGIEASPNESGDFNNDGKVDACIAATDSGSVWILLGAGDGTFSSVKEIPVGDEPHGITALDVDGDGDLDVVNANNGSDNLSLMINQGNGTFASPSFFDGGVTGEYGLTSADMNSDGITDLVVAGRDGEQIRTLLGNGNGTFTPAGPATSSGGATWVVVVDDVNGDGHLDATVANSFSNNGAVLIGHGDGTFAAPDIMPVGAHTVSTDLGDLDGDGDVDWVLSSFGGGFWRIYTNDGTGHFTFDQEITAPSNPSCSILYDADNDGDLDLALTDEIADLIVLMENESSRTFAPRSFR